MGNQVQDSKVIFVLGKSPFPLTIKNINNGFLERVYGLYYGYLKRHGGSIYSFHKNKLYNSRGNLLKTYLNVITFLCSISSSNNQVIIMVYPTVMKIFYIIPLLFFLRIIKRIKIIFDIHDLKIEQQETFDKRKIGFLERTFYRLIDHLYLGLLADTIITVSPRMSLLLRKLYFF